MLAERLTAVLDELNEEIKKRGITEALYMTKYSFQDKSYFHFGESNTIADIYNPANAMEIVKRILNEPTLEERKAHNDNHRKLNQAILKQMGDLC